jgi:hypothetical protein
VAHQRLLRRVQSWHRFLQRTQASLLKQQRREAGYAMPVALITALLVIVGVAIVGTRSLTSWLGQTGESQHRAARDAAEFGFNELMGQLNAPENSFLLVTRGSQWGSITYNDLGACGVGVPDANSVSGNAIKGLLGARNATPIADSNNSLRWRLDNFEAPRLPPGTNQAQGVCTSEIAAKFGNLSGGSAQVRIIGEALKPDGSVAAKYILERAVSVIPPEDDAIGNPILLMSTGSELFGLNGNICQGSPSDTSCTTPKKLDLTLVSCVNLGDCVDRNIAVMGEANVPEFCKKKKKDKSLRQFKRNTVCNNYQQAPLLSELPPYPAFNNTTYFGTAINDLSTSIIRSVQVTKCSGGPPAKCSFLVDFVTGTDFNQTQSFYFPYNTTTPPTSTSTLLPMCQNTADGAITCRIDQLHKDSTGPLTVYTRTPDSSVNKPVNLFVGVGGSKAYDSKTFNLDRGIINSALYNKDGAFAADASQAWRSLRILSRGFTSAITQACSVKDEIKIDDKRTFGVDGAFVWLPDARMTFKKKDRSASYVVAWICELDGDKDDKNPSTIVTPLQATDVKAGLSEMYGSTITTTAGGYYRAKSSWTVEDSSLN